MSPPESAARATQWLSDLVGELSGLRNATSRDPSFKNWRQNAITTMQRIWPADQEHAERFRRIPFSPVDPRADMRVQRESFSRGCQEAARVLNSFIEEIRAYGVPASGAAQQTEESGFVDGFPTVDLPSRDLGGAGDSRDEEREGMTPQGGDPRYDSRELQMPQPQPPQQTPSGSEVRPGRKGLGVAAKLRDLLGLTGFGTKPVSPPPAHGGGGSGTFQAQPPPSLDIVPVGDEVDERPRVPRSRATAWPQRPGPTSGPPAPAPPAPAPPAAPTGSGNPPPAEPGMSVVMSRPTTLRSSIGKVSIESLISPEFRGGAESGGVTPPAPSTPPADSAAGRPPLSIVPPLASDPEFDTDPEPPTPPAKTNKGDTPAKAATSGGASKIVPLPQAASTRGMNPRVAEPPADAAANAGVEASATSNADAEEFARATEDFMRSSPVLGATGHRVQRPVPGSDAHGFTDPDAIAVMSLVEELTQLDVPATRQSETRARLLDLARRMEANQIEWNALRKAVWFAMEYPEIARRVMPLLLPWIDRAA